MDKDETIQRLEERIDEVEATIKKMVPSRRDALKLGGAAVIGGAAMSGTASAGSSQVGTIGDASNPVDLFAEDIDNSDTITTDTLDTNRITGTGKPYLETGDLSSMQAFTELITADNDSKDLVNVTNGPGVLISGFIAGDNMLPTDIKIDGASTISIPQQPFGDAAGHNAEFTPIPPILYNSSLVITMNTGGGTETVAGVAHII